MSSLSAPIDNFQGLVITGDADAPLLHPGSIYIDPSSLILPAVNETFTVDVRASGVSGLSEFFTRVEFNGDAIRFLTTTEGPGVTDLVSVGSNPLRIETIIDIDPALSGDILLYQLEFRVLSRVNTGLAFVGDIAGWLRFTDSSGHELIPSTIIGTTFTNTLPIPGTDAVAAVSISETSADAGDEVVVNITFDQSVNGLMSSDIITNVGTLSDFQGSGSAYRVTLTLPSSGMGTANVILAADSVTEGNNSAFDSVSYSTPVPVIPPATVVLQSNQATFSNPSGPLIQGTDHVYFLSDITVTGLNSPLVINIDVGDFTFDADIVTSNEFSALYASEALSNRGSLPPGGNPIAVLRLGQGVSIGDTTEIKVFASTGPVTTHLEAGDPVVLSSPYLSFSPANSSLEIEGSLYVFRTTATVTSLPVGNNITFNFSIGGSQYGPVYITTADPGFSQYDEDVGAGLFIFEETLLPSNTGDSVLISVAPGIEINSTGSMLVGVSNNAAEFYGLISPGTPPPVDTDAVATLSIAQTSAETGDQVPINITFDQTVTNFTLLDLATNGGTLSNFSGSGASYSAILNIPSTGSGTIIVRLLADSVDEGNNAASDFVSYSTPTPTVVTDTVIFSSPNLSFNPSSGLILERDNGEVYFKTDYTVTSIPSNGLIPITINIDGNIYTETVDVLHTAIPGVVSNAGSGIYVRNAFLNPSAIYPGIFLSFGSGISVGDSADIILKYASSSNIGAGSAVTFSSPHLSFDQEETVVQVGNVNSRYVAATATVTSLPSGTDPITLSIVTAFGTHTYDFEREVSFSSLNYHDRASVGLVAVSEFVISPFFTNGILDVGSEVNVGYTGELFFITGNNFETGVYEGVGGVVDPPVVPPVIPPSETDAIASVVIVPLTVETGAVVPVSITFDQTVTGLTASDLSVNGGVLSGFAGSGSMYSVNVTVPSSGSGTIVVSLAADAVNEGNNAASDSFSYAEPADPVASIIIIPLVVETGSVVPVSIVFNQTVTGLTASDLSVDVGTLSGFAGSGSMYSVNVTVPSSGSGTIVVSLAADAVNEGNNAVIGSFDYAESVPEPEPEPEPVVFTSVYDAFIKETTHFQPRVIVEIGGVDVSHLLVEDHSVTTDSLLDTPTFNIYTTAVARFCLDNSDNQFNIKESPNFFTALGLPENGWQASVRISVLFENEGAPADARVIFVGYLEDITELSSPRWVSLLVLDKSGLLQHRVVEDFGRAVRANISGIDVGSDYTDVVPVFNLPENSTPVSRNSFSAGIHGGSIFQILPSLPLSGEYASYLYAGLDENTGQLLLGASPPEGEQTILSVGYKSAYRYRTPEALVFLLLEASGLLNDLTDDEKIFAKSLIESPDLEHTRAQWTSHGRPQVGDPISETPVVRWITSDNGVFYLGGNRKLFQYERRDDASGVLDEYTLLSDCPDSDASIMQFAREGSDFYVLTVNSFTGAIAKLWKVEDGVTWTAIVGANATAAHFYDYDTQRDMVADNRKSFVIHRGWLYFVSGISIRRYELSSGTLETVYSQGTPTQYSWDFVIHSGNLYCFGTQRPFMMDTHFKIYRMGVDGSGVTELYSETFARSTTRIEPASVSDIVVRGSNFYFVLTFSRRENRVGFTELCRMNVSGASRRVLKRYENALFSGRSLVVQSEGTVDNIYFVEGTWVSRYFDVDDYPTKEDAGHLIKIDMADRLVDLGLAWQSFRSVDGRGQHTAFSSNLWSDSDTETFHCISGYGLPVDARDDSLLSLSVGEVASPGNWVWLQYGKKLSVKVPVFPTNDRTVWSLLEELARTVDFEVGFTSGQDEMVSFGEIYSGLTLEPKGYLFFRARSSRLSNVHIDESSLQHLESSLDTTLVFNYISVAFGGGAPWIAQDRMLVESDGVLWYPVDTRLLQNESVAWAELIGNRVLERQKEPRLKTRLPLKFSPHLELGQRVLLTSEYHSLDAAVYKLTQVEHDTNLWRTEIEAREDLDAVDGLVLREVQDYEFNVGDSVSEVLESASGGVIPYMYELLDAPSWVTFTASTLTFSGTAVVGETLLRYRVRDDSGRIAEVSFRLIVALAGALTFGSEIIPDYVHEVGCEITRIVLPEASGGVAPRRYSLSGLPDYYVFNDVGLTIDGIPETVGPIGLVYTVTDSRSSMQSSVSRPLNFIVENKPLWAGIGLRKFNILDDRGMIVEKIQLYLLDNTRIGDGANTYKKIRLFDENGVREMASDILIVDEDYIDFDVSETAAVTLSGVFDVLAFQQVYRLRLYDLEGGHSSTILLPEGSWVACAITSNRIYALDESSTCVFVFSRSGTDITSEKIILNITGKIVSMLVNGGILYLLLDNSSVILAYDLSTNLMSSSNYKYLIEGGSDWVGFDIDPRNNIIHAVRKTSRHSVAVALNNSERLADADISFY